MIQVIVEGGLDGSKSHARGRQDLVDHIHQMEKKIVDHINALKTELPRRPSANDKRILQAHKYTLMGMLIGWGHIADAYGVNGVPQAYRAAHVMGLDLMHLTKEIDRLCA